jgi:hypothetical protein
MCSIDTNPVPILYCKLNPAGSAMGSIPEIGFVRFPIISGSVSKPDASFFHFKAR